MRNVVFSLGGTNKKKSQLVSITFLKVVCKRVMFIVVQAVPYCIKNFETFSSSNDWTSLSISQLPYLYTVDIPQILSWLSSKYNVQCSKNGY